MRLKAKSDKTVMPIIHVLGMVIRTLFDYTRQTLRQNPTQLRALFSRFRRSVSMVGLGPAIASKVTAELEKKSLTLADSWLNWLEQIFGPRAVILGLQAHMALAMGLRDQARRKWQNSIAIADQSKIVTPHVEEYLHFLKDEGDLDEALDILNRCSLKSMNSIQQTLFFHLCARFGRTALLQEAIDKQATTNKFAAVVEVVPIREVSHNFKVLRSTYVMQTCEPRVFGDRTEPPRHSVTVPETFLAELTDVDVYDGMVVIKDSRFIVTEPAAHPKQGFVAGNWMNVTGCAFDDSKAYTDFDYEATDEVEKGILISGRASFNYFHWLIEYLPKLYTVFGDRSLDHVPLVISASTPAQGLQALDLLAGSTRSRYIVQSGKRTKFHRLIIPSTPTYLPDRFDIPLWTTGALSAQHIHFLREQILSKLNLVTETPARNLVYLVRRSPGQRNAQNASEVESLFRDAGFQIVQPEQLSFEEQVRLFHGARVVVGAGGAGLTNLIFCQPNAHIFSLVSDQMRDFPIFANLADLVGVNFQHVTGDSPRDRRCYIRDDAYFHAPFVISLEKIKQLIDLVKSAETELNDTNDRVTPKTTLGMGS